MLTNDQAQKILQGDLKNLVAKISRGETLTSRERDFVEGHMDGDKEAKNISELCKLVGISRPTFYKYQKTEGSPPSLSVEEWLEFIEMREASGGARSRVLLGGKSFTPQDIIDLKALETQERHKRLTAERKLKEIELKKVELGWVPIADAKKAILQVTTMILRLLENFPKRYANRVDPSNPDEAEEILRDCISELQSQMEASAPNES